MKLLALLIAKLYPLGWRRRYGHELEALIEDSKPSLSWLLDILKGALTMQIKSNGLRIALFGIAGALIAAASSFAIADSYVGTAVLGVRDANAAYASAQQILSRRSLWRIIEKNQLYESDRNSIPLEDVIDIMRHSIKIGGPHKRGAQPQAIVVSFQTHDRTKAKTVTEDLAQIFLKDSGNINRVIGISSPAVPISPNRASIVVVGLIAGLLAGAGYTLIMNMRRAA